MLPTTFPNVLSFVRGGWGLKRLREFPTFGIFFTPSPKVALSIESFSKLRNLNKSMCMVERVREKVGKGEREARR